MEKDLIDDMPKDAPNDLCYDECGDGYINGRLIDADRPHNMETIMVIGLLLQINVILPGKRHGEIKTVRCIFFLCLDVKILEPNPIDR